MPNRERIRIRIVFLCGLLFLLFPLAMKGQEQPKHVEGRVIDATTKEPLAFVNILVNDGQTGISSDIDGKFYIRSAKPVEKLKCTYVGYKTLTYLVPSGFDGFLVLQMERSGIDLPEVTIYPEENPAHRIINLAIGNRDRNDPEKLKSFSYTSYERTILTAQADSLPKYDSLFSGDTLIADSSYIQFREFFDNQDIAIMETVTEKKFLAPDKNHQNVLANRVSGFRDPIFVFLISQFQSSSFYDDMFHIFEKHYVNPVSGGSPKKYFFLIEDTTYTSHNDTVFIISYRPRINTNFDGLEGVLYINSNGWAIQNVIARPAEESGIGIKIQQKYELIDGKHWFPVQLNTDITLFDAIWVDSLRQVNMIASGRSYIKDIEINPELVRREFDVLGVDVEPDSHEKPDEFWEGYRIDSLSERDRRTYHLMDSLGREVNLDRFATAAETIVSGKIPVKFIDIDLDRIVKYDGYQGWYLGLGAHTNNRLSKRFSIGGYWGYGFKDMTAKYGGDASYIINRRREVSIMASYAYDVVETGGVSFVGEEKSIFAGERWRDFLINRMNLTEEITLGLSARVLRDFKFHLALSSTSKQASYNYRYVLSDEGPVVTTGNFDFTELKIGFRFAFREEFLVTKRSRVSLGTRYPVVRFQYTHGFDNFLMGDYRYDRYDLRISHSFYTKYLGRTGFEIRGGLILGEVPYCNLYNGNGSYRQVTVHAPSSFSTMRMNEFLSDRYLAVYFVHNFGSLLFRTEKFRPEFLIATHAAWGELATNGGRHLNVDYKTMEHGYFESGLLINNLLNLRIYSIGIGGFYRYGPYSLPSVWENTALRLTIVFPMNER